MAVKSPPNRPAARQPRPPAQAQAASRPKPPRNNDRFAHDMWGLGLVALGLILLVSLLLRHHAGLLGGALVQGLRHVVGIGAWVFPVFLTAIGVMLIRGREQHTRTNFAGGAALLFVIGIAWWHLGHTSRARSLRTSRRAGGSARPFRRACGRLIGDVSSHILLLIFSLGAIVWATDMRLMHLFDHAVQGGKRVTGAQWRKGRESRRAGGKIKARRR